MVSAKHLLQHLFHLFPELGREEYLYIVSLRKEFLAEVEGGLEVVFEVGILGSGLDFLLRMVERKRPHIIHIRGVGTDDDALGFLVGAQHAIAISEEAFGVEVLREQEGFFGLFKSLHTVERKDGGCLSLGALGKEVPALLEHLDGVRLDGDGVAFLLVELVVRQEHLVAWNMEKKSLLEEVKRMDVQCIVIGLSIVFSAVTAILGYGMLSISNAMVLTFYCVMNGMNKDLRELCNSLVEDEDEE